MKALRVNVRTLLIAGSLLLLGSAGGYKLWRVVSAPKVPALHLDAAEPEIVEAVNAAAAAVRAAPRVSVAWGKLGAILFVHELYGDAAAVFAQAAALDPQQPRWPYLRALSLADLRPVDAIPLLQRAAELTRDAVPAPRSRLAEALLERGRLDEAEQHFHATLERFPGDPRALLGLGRIALSRDDRPRSIELLEKSAHAAPGVRDTRVLLATAYGRAGDKGKAEAAALASKALSREAAWPDPFVAETEQFRVGKEAALKKAQAMLDQQQLPELIAFMQEQITRYAAEPRAWRLLGAAYLREKKYPDAERALRRAIALPPETADALTQLGMALYYQDANADAESFFRRALQLQPNDAAAMFGVGLCEVEKRDWPTAIEAFQQASRSKPDWVRPYMGLGDSLTKNGQPQMAIEPLQRAVALEPQNAQASALLRQAQEATAK